MIVMDFVLDAKQICDQLLTSYGIDNTRRKHPDDSILDYFIYWFRVCNQAKRTVLKSDVFSCPSGYEGKLKHLESVINRGDDLRPYMSKSVLDLRRDDNLLSDWHIFHLHLSDSFSQSPLFVDRSDYLVLSMITPNAVLFLDCIPHPAPGDAVPWALIDYLEIVLRNWPELMLFFKVNRDNEPVELTNNYNSSEIAALRSCQINVIQKLSDGNAYLGPGMGISGDGSPSLAVQYSNCFYHDLIDLKKTVVFFINEGAITVSSAHGIDSIKIKLISFDLNKRTFTLGGDCCENQIVIQKQLSGGKTFNWRIIR